MIKQSIAAAVLAIGLLGAPAAHAAEQTIKLSVPGMSCPSCPYMVKQVIVQVGGIKAVDVSLEDRTATVTFDDALASVEKIRQATASIGYPSTLIK